MSEPRWIELAQVADISADKPRTIKIEGHQLAVFRDGDEVFAVDNRCPHEGYPLSTGKLAEGILTCEWHNWKFELCSGTCVLGGEDVRSYPLRVEGERIMVDLAPPDDLIGTLQKSLFDAFVEADFGWAGRVIERLLAAGVAPLEILESAVIHAASRLPYGFDHGLAVAADLAARLDGSPAAGELLLEACQAMILPNLRRPPRPPATTSPGEVDPTETALRAAIEGEDTDRAEVIVRAALAAGVAIDEVSGWLSRAASDHFGDYGHAEIYAVKSAELAERLGHGDGAASLMVELARGLSLATREDRLPYMRRFGKLVEPYAARLEAWSRGSGAGPLDAGAIIDAAVDGDLEDALGQVAAALDAEVAPTRVALALSIAAGHRLARFDERLEADPEIGHGWLDITHLLTHADAAAEINRRWPGPDALRSLFFSARFIQHTAPLDHREAPALEAVDDPESLWPLAMDGGSTPIFFAHRIKTSEAAVRLVAAIRRDRTLGQRPDAAIALAAVTRYLRAPIDERRVRGRAEAARRFVHEGQRPITRLGY